jgi:hypothetical protein
MHAVAFDRRVWQSIEHRTVAMKHPTGEERLVQMLRLRRRLAPADVWDVINMQGSRRFSTAQPWATILGALYGGKAPAALLHGMRARILGGTLPPLRPADRVLLVGDMNSQSIARVTLPNHVGMSRQGQKTGTCCLTDGVHALRGMPLWYDHLFVTPSVTVQTFLVDTPTLAGGGWARMPNGDLLASDHLPLVAVLRDP